MRKSLLFQNSTGLSLIKEYSVRNSGTETTRQSKEFFFHSF